MAYQKKELSIGHMMILRDIIDDWPHTDITPQQFRSELIRLCRERNIPIPSPKLANKWLVIAGCRLGQTYSWTLRPSRFEKKPEPFWPPDFYALTQEQRDLLVSELRSLRMGCNGDSEEAPND